MTSYPCGELAWASVQSIRSCAHVQSVVQKALDHVPAAQITTASRPAGDADMHTQRDTHGGVQALSTPRLLHALTIARHCRYM